MKVYEINPDFQPEQAEIDLQTRALQEGMVTIVHLGENIDGQEVLRTSQGETFILPLLHDEA